MDELIREFLIESQEGLDRMERNLTELEARPGDAELLAEIFRTVHTIKGATMPQLQAFFHYGGHSFLPKPDATPLQAADMLAWEAGKFKSETIDRPMREMRGSLLSLLEVDPSRYSAHHMEGRALERYLRRIRGAMKEQLLEEAIWEGIRKRVQSASEIERRVSTVQ